MRSFCRPAAIPLLPFGRFKEPPSVLDLPSCPVRKFRHPDDEPCGLIMISPLPVPTHLSRARPQKTRSAPLVFDREANYTIRDICSVGLQDIKLGDPPNAYTLPSSLTVHLSKIPITELRLQAPGTRPPLSLQSPLQSCRRGASPGPGPHRRLRCDSRRLRARK